MQTVKNTPLTLHSIFSENPEKKRGDKNFLLEAYRNLENLNGAIYMCRDNAEIVKQLIVDTYHLRELILVLESGDEN